MLSINYIINISNKTQSLSCFIHSCPVFYTPVLFILHTGSQSPSRMYILFALVIHARVYFISLTQCCCLFMTNISLSLSLSVSSWALLSCILFCCSSLWTRERSVLQQTTPIRSRGWLVLFYTLHITSQYCCPLSTLSCLSTAALVSLFVCCTTVTCVVSVVES